MITKGTTQLRQLGSLAVFPLALGCMGMSGMYGPADEAESIATIHAALDARRQPARHRRLLRHGPQRAADRRARSARPPRQGPDLGQVRRPARPGRRWLGFDARPAAVKNFARLHPDPPRRRPHRHLPPGAPRSAVPIEDTDRRHRRHDQGRLRARTSASPRSAPRPSAAPQAVHPIADLQIEYSLISRGPEAQIFPVLAELGIAVTAYGVLSRGLLTGSTAAAQGDFRAHLPRFAGENRRAEPAPRRRARRARRRARASPPPSSPSPGCSPRAQRIVPLIGARTRTQLDESLGALDVDAVAGGVARIEAAVPADAVAGTRYDAHQMRLLDSEK